MTYPEFKPDRGWRIVEDGVRRKPRAAELLWIQSNTIDAWELQAQAELRFARTCGVHRHGYWRGSPNPHSVRV